MTQPMMLWELAAKNWCHVAGEPSLPEHRIAEARQNDRLRQYCPKCGAWLEEAINGDKIVAE